MEWSKTPPTKTGYYRLRQGAHRTVAHFNDELRVWSFHGRQTTLDMRTMAVNQYEFGPEVTFGDEPSVMPAPTKQDAEDQVDCSKECRERRFYEQAFLAAMQGDWATMKGGGTVSDVTLESNAKLYKRAAQAAVKVMAEGNQ